MTKQLEDKPFKLPSYGKMIIDLVEGGIRIYNRIFQLATMQLLLLASFTALT